MELFCNTTLRVAKFVWSFTFYTSPFWIAYMFKNQYFTVEGVPYMLKCGNIILCIVLGAMWCRGMGRYNNSEYQKFIKVLEAAKQSSDPVVRQKVRNYDFDFNHWPVGFSFSESTRNEAKPLGLSLEKMRAESSSSRSPGLLSQLIGLPCELLSYCTMHTFGRWLVYPGHTELLNQLVASAIQENRDKMIEKLDGLRAKLKTKDNNSIDVMFFDRRQTTQANGQKLVICTEGNAGFYEIGCIATPLDCGYSVLGWNHPGFGGSTGKPYPSQEQAAMEVVIQYAVEKLGFRLEDITLFAWSIGGYASTWAAMNYPRISGIILDATFDDIVPLGLAKMPERMKGFAHRSLRQHMNLNIAEQLIRYPGPIRLLRRTKDEVIITSETPDVAFNRGNDLLIKLMQHRYPTLMNLESVDLLTQYLHAADQISMLAMFNALEIDEEACIRTLQSYCDKHSSKYPMLIGEDMSRARRSQLVIFLASKYMTDFEATHCNPLPVPLFVKPWSLDDGY
ncbi:Protein ABHD16A [Holothuria leucospilota]|uniref:Protein ABHD16A n=1 Tax=Holothuria leucospilota TaxID=206669 RepID=A0A9Q1C5Y5_HOLLE|nr:Protein ABHD16A [Holothuria leucospilota]